MQACDRYKAGGDACGVAPTFARKGEIEVLKKKKNRVGGLSMKMGKWRKGLLEGGGWVPNWEEELSAWLEVGQETHFHIPPFSPP